jgi:ubiquinone/menaquinone biosynthesis C-methylase UbiE
MTDRNPSTRRAREEGAVARAYDAWAASYDADRNATRDLDAEVVRRAPLGVAGADVLELGCGTGKNTALLAGRARSVLALDLSPGMLARARERPGLAGAGHVHLVRHDVRDPWPVAGASVDVVVGNLVLEHVEALAPVYAEAARVLRPGGRLFLCELHPERQRRGARARFTDAATGETVHVAAHLHTVGEYVNGGIAAGLALRHLGEWLEEGAPREDPPRLLSVLFERVGGSTVPPGVAEAVR